MDLPALTTFLEVLRSFADGGQIPPSAYKLLSTIGQRAQRAIQEDKRPPSTEMKLWFAATNALKLSPEDLEDTLNIAIEAALKSAQSTRTPEVETGGGETSRSGVEIVAGEGKNTEFFGESSVPGAAVGKGKGKGKGKAVARDSSSPTNKTDPPPRAQSEPRRSPRVNTCPLSSDTELETAGTPDPAPADVALPKGCPDYCDRVLVRPHDMPAHRCARRRADDVIVRLLRSSGKSVPSVAVPRRDEDQVHKLRQEGRSMHVPRRPPARGRHKG